MVSLKSKKKAGSGTSMKSAAKTKAMKIAVKPTTKKSTTKTNSKTNAVKTLAMKSTVKSKAVKVVVKPAAGKSIAKATVKTSEVNTVAMKSAGNTRTAARKSTGNANVKKNAVKTIASTSAVGSGAPKSAGKRMSMKPSGKTMSPIESAFRRELALFNQHCNAHMQQFVNTEKNKCPAPLSFGEGMTAEQFRGLYNTKEAQSALTNLRNSGRDVVCTPDYEHSFDYYPSYRCVNIVMTIAPRTSAKTSDNPKGSCDSNDSLPPLKTINDQARRVAQCGPIERYLDHIAKEKAAGVKLPSFTGFGNQHPGYSFHTPDGVMKELLQIGRPIQQENSRSTRFIPLGDAVDDLTCDSSNLVQATRAKCFNNIDEDFKNLCLDVIGPMYEVEIEDLRAVIQPHVQHAVAAFLCDQNFCVKVHRFELHHVEEPTAELQWDGWGSDSDGNSDENCTLEHYIKTGSLQGVALIGEREALVFHSMGYMYEHPLGGTEPEW